MPVTSFAEWTVEPDPATGRKQKVWFARADGEPFVCAGVVRPTAPGELDPFAFLTCEPNALIGAVHPKAMSVILASDGAADAWLAGTPAEPLACPCAEDHLAVVEV